MPNIKVFRKPVSQCHHKGYKSDDQEAINKFLPVVCSVPPANWWHNLTTLQSLQLRCCWMW